MGDQPSSQAREPEPLDELELRDYLRRLWREKWLMLAIFVGVVVLVAIIALLLPRPYETETALLIMPPVSEQLDSGGELEVLESGAIQLRGAEGSSRLLSPDAYQRLALADDLLEEIIRTLTLRSDARNPNSEFLSVQALKEQVQVEAISGRWTPSGGSRSTLLTLRVQGEDPERIQRVAERWARLFIERHSRWLESTRAQSYEFIQERVSEVRQALKAEEQQKTRFLQEHPPDFLESELSALVERYETTMGRLAEKRLARAEQQAKARHLGEALDELSSDDDQANRVSLALREQRLIAQAEIAALESGIRHLEEQLEVLEEEIAQKAARIIEVRTTLAQLEREIETLSRTYASLSDRLQGARIAKAESASSIRVVENAIVPREPLRSRTLVYLAVGAVLGLILGVLVASFKVYMTPRAPAPAHEREER